MLIILVNLLTDSSSSQTFCFCCFINNIQYFNQVILYKIKMKFIVSNFWWEVLREKSNSPHGFFPVNK